MTANNKWMIYGATGYTGKLIAAKALQLGQRPTLAGRNPDKVRKLAEELDLPWAAFSVDDENAAKAALKNHALVLSVAGPFSATAREMMNACITTGTHYLDVTGEIAVFELAASIGEQAKAAGVTLLPGVGFDVVPSDCLAAHTAKRAKKPVSLRIAIKGLGGPSQGTAKTAVEALGTGTMARKDGVIMPFRAGKLQRNFNLGAGDEPFLGVSWGDVSTAYYSTGINDIEVYFPNAGPIKSMTTASRFFGPIMGTNTVKNFLKRQIDKMPAGPTEKERERDTSVLLAEVVDEDGTLYRSLLETPNGYTLTAESAVKSAMLKMDGKGDAGFQTPSLAFGQDFATTLGGTKLTDL